MKNPAPAPVETRPYYYPNGRTDRNGVQWYRTDGEWNWFRWENGQLLLEPQPDWPDDEPTPSTGTAAQTGAPASGVPATVWVVEVLDGDGALRDTYPYTDEAVARGVAAHLTTISATEQQNQEQHAWLHRLGYTAQVVPMGVNPPAPHIALVYKGYVMPIAAPRPGQPIVPPRLGIFPDTIDAPDAATLAATPGVTSVHVTGSAEIGYDIVGPDPVAVRAEQRRLWQQVNPHLPWTD